MTSRTSRAKPRQAEAGEAGRQRTHPGPLLIAGEDAEHARGALHMAELLARRDRVGAHVLGVVRPVSLPGAFLPEQDREALEAGRRQLQLRRLRQRLAEATGISAFFKLDVVTGSPAPALAEAARARGAELILVGIEEQGAERRTATEDAALQITRASDTPVLAVPANHSLLPRNALVAMDFAAASRRAAMAALPLLARGASLILAYVEPDLNFAAVGMESWAAIHEQGVAALFEKLRASLSVPGDVHVDTVILRGDPAAAILEHARTGGFDLIVTGTQGLSALDRHLTGSVSTAILRGARCPVLIAPPAP